MMCRDWHAIRGVARRGQKTYRYDPEGAEALLDAAGYPRGADGIRFKMGMAYFERYDVSYAELVAGYWREIAWTRRLMF